MAVGGSINLPLYSLPILDSFPTSSKISCQKDTYSRKNTYRRREFSAQIKSVTETDMGYAINVGKYQLGRTIGEGSFAKVKLAVNSQTGHKVAIKIIDKQMVVDNKLMDQVQREISTMKLLHHPNIVQIHEVIATKTKIYLVMEYVSGGQLSEKMSYIRQFNEDEARKYFQQLMDAIDYCHCRGVYHRDLKPENLLLDRKGNLKVTDFGLSVLHKPGDSLSTACGSPSYVAPEVIAHKSYEGSAADLWSCGVILFELLAGYLPFEDCNLMHLYQKISRAEYACPEWFTAGQRKLIFRILDPLPKKRVTVAEILEDEWFQIDYKPSMGIDRDGIKDLDDVNVVLDSLGESNMETDKGKPPTIINAFQLIAMSNDLDLSGLFEDEDNKKQRTRLGSEHSIQETIEKIEVAAKHVPLSVERVNASKVRLRGARAFSRCRSHIVVLAEVIEVAPSHCVVEILKLAGELRVHKEFCESLSSVLKEGSGDGSSQLQMASAAARIDRNDSQKIEW